MGYVHEPEVQTEYPVEYEEGLTNTVDALVRHSSWLARGGWKTVLEYDTN